MTVAAPPAGDEKRGKRFNEQQRRLPVGVRLRHYRDAAGLSHRELGALTQQIDPYGIGLHATTISRIEQEKQNARAETVKILADALTLALKRTVTPNDLYTSYGPDSLSDFLERERQRRTMLRGEFARLLGLSLERYSALVDKRATWTPLDLPGIARALPEAHPLTLSVLAEYKPGT